MYKLMHTVISALMHDEKYIINYVTGFPKQGLIFKEM